MIRKLAFILLAIVLAAIGFLGYSIYDRLEEEQAITERIASLPEFSAVTLDGEMIQMPGAAKGSPLILTYINTDCKFCRAEIQSIRRHKDLQEKSTIYLVSDEPTSVLKHFAEDAELDSLRNILVLQDSDQQIKRIFGIVGVPSTFVYGIDGTLLQSFKGETKAEVLYDELIR